MRAADCGNWWRAGRGQLAELGRRVALLEEQARRREEELAGAGRWTAKTGGRHRCGVRSNGAQPGPSLLHPGPGAVGQISWLTASGSRRRGANVLLAHRGALRAAFGPGTPCSGPARRVLWRGSGLFDGRRQCYGRQSCPEHLAEHGGGTCVSLFHPTLLSRACSGNLVDRQRRGLPGVFNSLTRQGRHTPPAGALPPCSTGPARRR